MSCGRVQKEKKAAIDDGQASAKKVSRYTLQSRSAISSPAGKSNCSVCIGLDPYSGPE